MTVQPSSTGSRQPRQHDLKTWPEFFADLLDGNKPFELRKNDRDFQVGDELRLHEYDPATKEFSGRVLVRTVTYMLGHRPDAGCAATFGLQPGHVIMGISGAAQASPTRDDLLRGLAAFFDESVHHVWSNHEIAECLTDMIRTASPIPSTDRAAPISGTESCTCHFLGAGTHHIPGCPFYTIAISTDREGGK